MSKKKTTPAPAEAPPVPVGVTINPDPRGDWISNVHVDTLKHPAQAHLATDHDVGPPRGTQKRSAADLRAAGYVGLYIKRSLG